MKNGSLSIFLMGCGMFSFGTCAALAGWLIRTSGGANINVTIYNTGALLGSLFHIAGAVLSSINQSPRWAQGREKPVLVLVYASIVLFVVLFTFATVQRIVPLFFIQGSGPTLLRQIVLALSIIFYALSAFFFMSRYLRTKSDFLFWYSLCLGMLALGLFAFYIQKVVGSPIGWAGRTANYVGMVFAMVAVRSAVLSVKAKGLALEDIVSSFFRNAEASYQSLVETATDAIISYDQDRRIILWNSGAENIFGYTKGEAIGAPFFDLLLSEKYRALVEKLVTGTSSRTITGANFSNTVEIDAIKKNGSHFPVEVSAFARELPTGWVGTCIVRDITERKRAEEDLFKSKVKLEAIIESMNDAVFVSDNDGNFIDFNEAFATHHKFRSKAECYKTLSEYPDCIDVYFADGTLASLDMWAVPRALRGETVSNAEYILRRKDTGETWWGSYSFGPIRDRNGKIIGSVVAGRDITESKKAEEALKERSSQLEAANKGLESFTYSVSHDLRAPLRAIDGFSRMLLRGMDDKMDDEERRKFNIIRENAQLMGRLIDDLLAFSRLGRQEMALSVFNMNTLVDQAWEECCIINPGRRMELKICELPQAFADKGLIKQALLNLISNAVKFTRLREQAVIEIGGKIDGQENLYYIKDNGVGFEMRYYDKLFGVFQRLHTEKDYEGTGVGLAIVQQIIHRHGGRVWAEGKVEEGATFFFSLPAAETLQMLPG